MLPVVTDPKKAAGALKWAVLQMEQRYQNMAKVNARDLARYNALVEESERLPKLVVVIDELVQLNDHLGALAGGLDSSPLGHGP